MITFEVEWLGWDREVVASEQIDKRNLDAAIAWAANRIKSPRGRAEAHGFFVRKAAA